MGGAAEQQYGVAVVGCGLMGTRWGEEVNRIGRRLRLVTMMDSDLARARAAAKQCATRATDSFDAVLNDPAIHLAIVAVRADRHHQLSMALLQAGKHVLCEKPYSMDLSEIDQAIAASRAHRRKLRIGFMMRFLPGLTDLARRIHDDEMGRPLYFRHFLHQGGPDNWAYFQSLIDAAGSPAADCGIHYMDLFQWFAQERASQVFAVGVRSEPPAGAGPNLCQVLLRTPGGSAGWIEDCWTTVATPKGQLEIIGPKASAEFDWGQDGITVAWRSRGASSPTISRWPPSRKPLDRELAHFIEEIDDDRDLTPHLLDVRHATATALAANQSMKSGNPIHL